MECLAITLEKKLQLPTSNYLVLHSLIMVANSLNIIEKHTQVLLALDHGASGRRSTKFLLERSNLYTDISSKFAVKYGKDLNDYLREVHSNTRQRKLRR